MQSFASSIFFSFRNLMLADHHNITSLMRTSGLPKIEESRLFELCKISIEKLKMQSTLVRINGPAVVIGDIHGSIVDLLRIFGIFGFSFANENNEKNKQKFNKSENKNGYNFNPSLKYVFLGDYIDRGEFSLEVVTILLSAYCSYPNNIILLRGNHEFLNMSSNSSNFKDEILDHPAGYSPELFEKFHDVFAYLPYAAVINNNIFCVHGGLSNKLNSLQDIEKLSELRPIYDYKEITLIQDLVWSDPSKIGCCEFIPSTRNQGCVFGSAAVNNFYQNTGILAIIRGHSYVKLGVEIYQHINLISVFSSSNYNKNPIKLGKTDFQDETTSYFQNHPSNDLYKVEESKNKMKRRESNNYDNNNLCGVVFVNDQSEMSPEAFEPVELITRAETKLRTSVAIGFTSSQMLTSIPIAPFNKSDSESDTLAITNNMENADLKEPFKPESRLKSSDQKKRTKTPETNFNSSDFISNNPSLKPKKQFSLYPPQQKENKSSSSSSFPRPDVKNPKRRKLSHDFGKIYRPSFLTVNADDNTDESSSANTTSLSENSSSSSSNSSGKIKCNVPLEKITHRPHFIKASVKPRKKKLTKSSLPNMKFNNFIS